MKPHGLPKLALKEEHANTFFAGSRCYVDELDMLGLFPNEFIVVCMPELGVHAHARVRDDGSITYHDPAASSTGLIRPRNDEQSMALELLNDPSVPLVIMTGPAGTGKTLLALAAGKLQLGAVYAKMLITRPIVPLGRDLGYLPGTINEKMDPWIAPIRDNLVHLSGQNGNSRRKKDQKTLKQLFEQGLIEIQAVAYMRGRSLRNAFMIVDEAQNLDLASLKTIITRAGDGTKIVLTGDTDQIDTRTNSGLVTVIERFESHPLAAHVRLVTGERSPLATAASYLL